jgi:alpha-1,2-mannosyltransferase
VDGIERQQITGGIGFMPVFGRFFIRIGIVAAAFYVAWAAIQTWGRPYDFFDMKIYHGALVWWTQGGDLYDYIAPHTTLGFTYPPFAALTMLPMAAFTMLDAAWLNVAFGLISLAFVCAALLGPLTARMRWSRWATVALAVPVLTALEPVRESLGYGQVNLILFALIIADLVALRRGWRWAGIGIGLATAIKLTPALFIVYFLVSKQWRAALTSTATAIGVTVATHFVVPNESATYWGSIIWQTERVGVADMTPNQSLAGLLARLYDSPHAPTLLWISFALVVLVVGLTRARAAHIEGDELIAFTLIGLTANVVSPISWSHHLVWVIPAIITLFDQALRRRAASRGIIARGRATPGLREPIWFPALTGARHFAAAGALYVLFLVSPIWPHEHQFPAVSHYAEGMSGVLWENSFAIALIVLVALLPHRPGADPAFGPSAPVRIPAVRAPHSGVPMVTPRPPNRTLEPSADRPT